MRTVAGLMLILLGLYIARWWQAVTYIERLGKHLWKHIQPFSKQLLPVSSVPNALLLGSLWGWLPCGLVYSTLIWSASAADWQTSAMLMAGFGIERSRPCWSPDCWPGNYRNSYNISSLRRWPACALSALEYTPCQLPVYCNSSALDQGQCDCPIARIKYPHTKISRHRPAPIQF